MINFAYKIRIIRFKKLFSSGIRNIIRRSITLYLMFATHARNTFCEWSNWNLSVENYRTLVYYVNAIYCQVVSSFLILSFCLLFCLMFFFFLRKIIYSLSFIFWLSTANLCKLFYPFLQEVKFPHLILKY